MVGGTYLILCVLPPTLHFSSSTEHQLEVHVTGFRTLTRSNISWYLWISHLWSSFCTHRHMLKKIFYQTSVSAWLTFFKHLHFSMVDFFFIKHLHFSMIEFFIKHHDFCIVDFFVKTSAFQHGWLCGGRDECCWQAKRNLQLGQKTKYIFSY